VNCPCLTFLNGQRTADKACEVIGSGSIVLPLTEETI